MKTWRWLLQILLTLTGAVVATNSAYAQLAYQHAWFSVDAGSAVSNTGDYTLRGVAGQADAGELKRDAYVLTGGVLAVSTAPFTPPPDQPPDEIPDDTPDDTPPDNTPPDNTPPDNTPPDNTPPDDTPPDDAPPDDTPPDDVLPYPTEESTLFMPQLNR